VTSRWWLGNVGRYVLIGAAALLVAGVVTWGAYDGDPLSAAAYGLVVFMPFGVVLGAVPYLAVLRVLVRRRAPRRARSAAVLLGPLALWPFWLWAISAAGWDEGVSLWEAAGTLGLILGTQLVFSMAVELPAPGQRHR
jgi:hypothetical protein